MPLTIWNCVLPYKYKNYFRKNRLVACSSKKITSITEFLGNNFLLPTFLTGGKFATVNFKPCRLVYLP